MSIKLIASDLDGTLIPEGTFAIKPEFFETLEVLLEKGYEFYAASGRPYTSIKSVFGKYADRISYICENGALVVEQEEDVFTTPFPGDLARALTETYTSDPRTEVFISGTRVAYTTSKNQDYIDLMVNQYKNDLIQIDSYDDMPEPAIKYSIRVYDVEINKDAVQQELRDKFGWNTDYMYSGNGWIDAVYRESGKGIALADVIRRKGLKPEEVMVFGDNENDVSMLLATPNSYVMKTSKDSVKQNASFETADVAETLKELLFRNRSDKG